MQAHLEVTMPGACLFVGGPLHFKWLRVEHLGREYVHPIEELHGLDVKFSEVVYSPVRLIEPRKETIFILREMPIRKLVEIEEQIAAILDQPELDQAVAK
jgi:hypothetical protein